MKNKPKEVSVLLQISLYFKRFEGQFPKFTGKFTGLCVTLIHIKAISVRDPFIVYEN